MADDLPTASWTLAELKAFLKKRGAFLSGKKAELLERALFYKNNPDAARTRSSVTSADAPTVAAEEAAKAPCFPISGWSHDPSSFPAVTTSTFLQHMLKSGKSVQCDGDDAGVVLVRRPLERGNEFFFGGYVHDVSVATSDMNSFVVGKCWASQHKTTKYCQKLVLTTAPESTSATVTYATCEGCVAGVDGGLCSHVFALLMVLEKYRSTEEAKSVTSLPCSWGPRQRDIEPKPIMDTVVERASMERKGPPVKCSLYESRVRELRTPSVENISRFRDSLPDGCGLKELLPRQFSTVTSLYGPTPRGSPLGYQRKPNRVPVAPQPLPVLTKKKMFPPLPLPARKERTSMGLVWPCSLQDAQALERRTIGQSSNKEWMDRHKYTLTASNFRRIVHCKTGQEKLLTSLFDQRSLSDIPAIRHGKQHERDAVAKYQSVKSDRGQPVSVRDCGLAVDPMYQYIGASPDAMVFDRSAQPPFGLREIKCPYAAFEKSMTVAEATAKDSNFCLVEEDGELKLRRQHPYFTQVQGQLGVCQLPWCDFFVWLGESFHLERIYADLNLYNNSILPALTAFYAVDALPYLSKLERPVPPDVPSSAPAAVLAAVPAAAASSAAARSTVSPWSQYEMLLPSDLSQSTIDGRNGSNACTIISSVFIRNCLETASADGAVDAMCEAMRSGNSIYDSLHTNALLSFDEVLALQPSVGVDMCAESFVQPAALDTMVELMSTRSQNVASFAYGGVFVITPYSFSLCSCQGRFILFDSHCHGGSGALLADVPTSEAADYVKYFFSRYYPGLNFNAAAPGNPAAHVTFLGLRQSACAT